MRTTRTNVVLQIDLGMVRSKKFANVENVFNVPNDQFTSYLLELKLTNYKKNTHFMNSKAHFISIFYKSLE